MKLSPVISLLVFGACSANVLATNVLHRSSSSEDSSKDYLIASFNSGTYIADMGEGMPVGLSGCEGGEDSQVWNFISESGEIVSPAPLGAVQIKNAKSGLCLATTKCETGNGSPINAGNCYHMGDATKFIVSGTEIISYGCWAAGLGNVNFTSSIESTQKYLDADCKDMENPVDLCSGGGIHRWGG